MVVPKHDVNDTAKVDRLVAAMRDGWPQDMPPVLVAGENEALTGTHRLAAARRLGIAPVTVNIQDAIDRLIETEGYSWEEIIMLDDDGLADALRSIGRADLARLAK